MITFNINNDKYKVYFFDKIEQYFYDYKNEFNNQINFLPKSLKDENDTSKSLSEEGKNDGQKLLINLIKSEIKNLNKDSNYDYTNDHLLIQNVLTNFEKYNCSKNFINSLFVSERNETYANIKGDIQQVNESDFQKFIDLAVLRDFYFTNKDMLFNYTQILSLFRCFENFHTHSSKYIDSSSSLSLNINSKNVNEPYLNSSTNYSVGLPMTLATGGGFGRDNSGTIKSLAALFLVNSKKISIYLLLQSLLEKIKNNDINYDELEDYLIKKLSFPITDLLSLYSLSMKLNSNIKKLTNDEEKILNELNDFKYFKDSFSANNLEKVSQVIWFDSEKFINLIPLPSVQVLSSLSVLKEKINEKYRENLLLKYENEKNTLISQDKETKSSKEAIKELDKKIKEIDKEYLKGVSHSVKSVASNPQNVSEYLSLKNGNIDRFNAYKYITIQDSSLEKMFYVFDKTFFDKKITDNELSSKLKTFINSSGKISLDELPNSVVNRIYKSFFSEISQKIAKNLKDYKYQFSKLPKDKSDKLLSNISLNSKNHLFQKYLLNLISTNELVELTNELIFKYENINDFNQIQKDEIKTNLLQLI